MSVEKQHDAANRTTPTAEKLNSAGDGWAGVWAAITLAAVVTYPLSIGPVVSLDTKLGSPAWLQTIGEVVYAPLFYAVETLPST
jgi:hypothetical protein